MSIFVFSILLCYSALDFAFYGRVIILFLFCDEFFTSVFRLLWASIIFDYCASALRIISPFMGESLFFTCLKKSNQKK